MGLGGRVISYCTHGCSVIFSLFSPRLFLSPMLCLLAIQPASHLPISWRRPHLRIASIRAVTIEAIFNPSFPNFRKFQVSDFAHFCANCPNFRTYPPVESFKFVHVRAKNWILDLLRRFHRDFHFFGTENLERKFSVKNGPSYQSVSQHHFLNFQDLRPRYSVRNLCGGRPVPTRAITHPLT